MEIAWIVLGVCLVLFIVGLLTSANARAFYTKIAIESKLKKIGGKLIVALDDDERYNYMLISKYGVSIIKVIFIPGEYFGSDKQANLTLINKGRKKTIKNPIKPVEEWSNKLKNEHNINNKYCVIFKSSFISGLKSNAIVKQNALDKFIIGEEIYSEEEINEIYSKLVKIKKTVVKFTI